MQMFYLVLAVFLVLCPVAGTQLDFSEIPEGHESFRSPLNSTNVGPPEEHNSTIVKSYAIVRGKKVEILSGNGTFGQIVDVYKVFKSLREDTPPTTPAKSGSAGPPNSTGYGSLTPTPNPKDGKGRVIPPKNTKNMKQGDDGGKRTKPIETWRGPKRPIKTEAFVKHGVNKIEDPSLQKLKNGDKKKDSSVTHHLDPNFSKRQSFFNELLIIYIAFSVAMTSIIIYIGIYVLRKCRERRYEVAAREQIEMVTLRAIAQ